ncbi:hypothetical protein EJ02DRAFT_461150 [Clathrospora elynae]|uniref:Uncharacterized protein n=1 Tax=Clathrospora elynae TaxID=706981 RepID=A0A6A5S7N8_9PLEO|nr:hypothetical protein EJ02DRAFT_461150 [Clathrospora elynae]
MNPAFLSFRSLPTRSALLLRTPHTRSHARSPRGGCSAIHEDSKNGQLAPLNGSVCVP